MSEIDCKPRCPRASFRRNGGHACRPSLQRLRRCHQRQHGAVSIVVALMLVVLLGFIGLSLNLAMLYNRRVELQGLADSTALAAARELIGTNPGVANALARARASAESFKFNYSTDNVMWSDAAIMFSATGAAGSWVDASAALAAPGNLLFAKVNTGALAPPLNTVDTGLMGLLPSASATMTTYGSAIAGRSSIRVTPLAICALSATPATARINPGASGSADVAELEEYGFRRGVGYDLMNLNPNGILPTENFIINPVQALGATLPNYESNKYPAMVARFVCSGILPMPSVMKSSAGISTPLYVGRPFPLADLFNQLNSRFDQYPAASPDMTCTPAAAPPDVNIQAYVKDAALNWMSPSSDPGRAQAAMPLTAPLPLPGKLWTIASPAPPVTALPPVTASSYGPLWSYARAVAYASSEPTNGYTALDTSTWPSLYPTSCATPPCSPTPAYSGSNTVTPYMAASGSTFLAPSRPGLLYRRVLNIPLLACPVNAGSNPSATVLAIGRFFMTVPATASSISAEFSGVVSETSLGGPVELYP